MPIYEYRCQQGHTFEVMQRMSDDPVAVCETCEGPVERVFHPVAVHFKGSGFYNTDYGTRKRAREKESAEGKDSGESSTKRDDKAGESGGAKSDSDSKASSSTAKSSESTTTSKSSTT